MKQHYKESRRKEVSYKQYIEGTLTVLVTSCVGTAFRNNVFEDKIEEIIEVTEGGGRKCKQLPDELKGKGRLFALEERVDLF